MIRVLILADDHSPVRAISNRIAVDSGIEVVGNLAALADALAQARASAVDLIMADARLWLGAGESELAGYRVRRTALPVVVITAQESRLEFSAVLRSSASCYCPITIDGRLLCEIIRRCAASPNNLEKLLRNGRDIPAIVREQFQPGRWPKANPGQFSTSSRAFVLSERERQILNMSGDGLTNAEIGKALGLDAKAVKNHMTSILRKLATT